MAEKKLAILDKALAKLPNSDSLMRLKWNIKREIYDPDKVNFDKKAINSELSLRVYVFIWFC